MATELELFEKALKKFCAVQSITEPEEIQKCVNLCWLQKAQIWKPYLKNYGYVWGGNVLERCKTW